MKRIVLISLTIFSWVNTTRAQINYSIGIESGGSRNKTNTSRDIMIAQHFNDRHVFKSYGHSSALLGMHGSLRVKKLYAGMGISYSGIQESYDTYDEGGFYYNENGQTTIKRSVMSTKQVMRFDKLNIPLELGIHMGSHYRIDPILFAGINVNYLISGGVMQEESITDAFTGKQTVTTLNMDALDAKDNYALSPSQRWTTQWMLGGGLFIGKRCLVKASYRKGKNLSLRQIRYPDNWINCFVNIYAIENSETTVSLLWLFGR